MQRKSKPLRQAGETDAQFAVRLDTWAVGNRAYMRAYDKARRTSDPAYAERRRETSRQWKAQNPERIRASRAAYFQANRETERENQDRFYAENPDAKAVHGAAYYARHKDRIGAYRRSDEGRAVRNARHQERYLSDPAYRVRVTLAVSLRQALRAQGLRKTQKIKSLIGCDVPTLCAHLENSFKAGMTWDNYGQWEIDHRRPCASFDLTDLAQQRACFHYTNLQPLWAPENRRKGARRDWLPTASDEGATDL